MSEIVVNTAQQNKTKHDYNKTTRTRFWTLQC